MNKRLLAYLRKLGLASDATDTQAWEFCRSLRGAQASIANALNYSEGDEAARTTADLMIRAAGFNPEHPDQILDARAGTVEHTVPGANGQNGTQLPGSNVPGVRTAGTDGGSLAGDVEAQERLRVEGEQRAMARIRNINEWGEMSGCSPDFIRTLVADPTLRSDDAIRARIRTDWEARTRANVPADLPNAGPAIHSRNSETDFNAQALSCAMMMRAGIADPTRRTVRYEPRLGELIVNDQAPSAELQRAIERGYQLRNLPAVVFIQRALALDGIRMDNPSVQELGYIFQTRGAAAMSTTSLVNIWTQTFGARLMQGWTEAPDTTQGWVDEEENSNYLPNERVQVGFGEGLAQLPRGAEAEDMTFGDDHAYTKVCRYARKAIFDDMDLQNDNFGVITSDVPTKMGEAARRLRPDLVYAVILSNPTMPDSVALFHATHGNLAAGAFSEANLEAAFSAMAVRQIGGVNVNITPKYILNPMAIDFSVDKVIDPNAVVITGSDIVRPNYNAIGRRGLVHRGDPRLDNGVKDPKTGTTYAGDLNDWYMVADGPAPIVVSYLAGTRRSPRFRSGVLDRGQFGVWFDVQHSMGAKAVHYETILKRTA
jgi:hypothetical protein